MIATQDRSDLEVAPSGEGLVVLDSLGCIPNKMSIVSERDSSGAGFLRDSGIACGLASGAPIARPSGSAPPDSGTGDGFRARPGFRDDGGQGSMNGRAGPQGVDQGGPAGVGVHLALLRMQGPMEGHSQRHHLGRITMTTVRDGGSVSLGSDARQRIAQLSLIRVGGERRAGWAMRVRRRRRRKLCATAGNARHGGRQCVRPCFRRTRPCGRRPVAGRGCVRWQGEGRCFRGGGRRFPTTPRLAECARSERRRESQTAECGAAPCPARVTRSRRCHPATSKLQPAMRVGGIDRWQTSIPLSAESINSSHAAPRSDRPAGRDRIDGVFDPRRIPNAEFAATGRASGMDASRPDPRDCNCRPALRQGACCARLRALAGGQGHLWGATVYIVSGTKPP